MVRSVSSKPFFMRTFSCRTGHARLRRTCQPRSSIPPLFSMTSLLRPAGHCPHSMRSRPEQMADGGWQMAEDGGRGHQRSRHLPSAICHPLRSIPQPLRENIRQTGLENRGLRAADVVLDAEELNCSFIGTEDDAGRARVAIARLSDGAGIDEITLVRLEADGRFATHGEALDGALTVDREDGGKVRVAEEDERRFVQREHLRGVMDVEDVLVFVVRRAVANQNAAGERRSDDEVAQESAIDRTEMIAR